MSDLSSVWRPRYGLPSPPAGPSPIPPPQDGDIYFDLEFLQQTESHTFGFEDVDQTLITSIAGVVRDGDTWQSLYRIGKTDMSPEIATGKNGERRVIFFFLEAVLAHLASYPRGATKLPRMFNFSGSGKAESRLPKRIEHLNLRALTQEEFTNLGLSFGGIEPTETARWNAAWDTIGDLLDLQKIKDDDLNDAISAHFGRFPNPPNDPSHGLKAIERYVPGLFGRGAVGSAMESKEIWRKIRSLRNVVLQSLINLPDGAEIPPGLKELRSFLDNWRREQKAGKPELVPDLWDSVTPGLLTPLGDPDEGWASGATAANKQSPNELSGFVYGLKCRSDRTAAEWAKAGRWNEERLELEALYTLYATMDCVSLLRVHEYAVEVLSSKATAHGNNNYVRVSQAIKGFPKQPKSKAGP